MILTKRQLLFPILILNRFLKSCVTSRCAMRTTLLNKKISLQDFFLRLRRIIFICEVAKFTHPSLEESLTIYLAKEKSGKNLFYVETKWFTREKIFFVDYFSTKKYLKI